MSGGYFDYKQYELLNLADQIEQLVYENDNQEKDQRGDTIGRGYSVRTVAEFRNAAKFLRLAQVYVQRIDWLVSDDDSEETFHKRLKVDLDKNL